MASSSLSAARRRAFGLVVSCACLLPGPALAQTRALGAGPRLSFVRGDVALEGTSDRYSGGQLRARLSGKTAVEISIDYRSHLNQSLTERIRDYPVQGSLLVYPVRASLSAYLLGGAGWYSQRVDTLNKELVVASKTTRTTGYHTGVGGEIRLGSRAAVHLDYRYTFIRFGEDPKNPDKTGAVPLPGLSSFQRKLKLSHQGSMWTSGVTVYF